MRALVKGWASVWVGVCDSAKGSAVLRRPEECKNHYTFHSICRQLPTRSQHSQQSPDIAVMKAQRGETPSNLLDIVVSPAKENLTVAPNGVSCGGIPVFRLADAARVDDSG